jgi:4-oxalocrotonate tautomerase
LVDTPGAAGYWHRHGSRYKLNLGSPHVYRNRRIAMPYVQLRVAGPLSREQKETIAKEFTATLERVAGKPPAATYVVIEEVPRQNWAKGGQLLE